MSLNDRQMEALSKIYNGLTQVRKDIFKAEDICGSELNLREAEKLLLMCDMELFLDLDRSEIDDLYRRYQEQVASNQVIESEVSK